MKLMVRPNWPGEFRRVMRDSTGNEVKVLKFAHGLPVEVSGKELAAVRDDMGKALVVVKEDDRGKLRIDWEATFTSEPAAAAEAPATAVEEEPAKPVAVPRKRSRKRG